MKEFNKISKNEMKHLIADYLNNNLDESSKETFENNLDIYPELKSEIEEFKSTFRTLEKIDYNNTFSQHTRNMSVKVNNRLEKSYNLSYNKFIKFAAPVIGVAAILLIFFNIDFNNNSTIVKNNNANIINLEASEVSVFLEDVNPEETIDLTLKKPNGTNLEVIVDNIEDENFEDIYNEYLGSTIIDDESFLNNFSDENVLKNTINELSDEEFQNLLKEIKNVEIIS